jgi:hypothetical protein
VDEDAAGLYLPLAQISRSSMGIAVRSRRPPMSLSQLVRSEVETIAPGQPVYEINQLDRAIEDQNVYYRLISDGFSILGMLSILIDKSIYPFYNSLCVFAP